MNDIPNGPWPPDSRLIKQTKTILQKESEKFETFLSIVGRRHCVAHNTREMRASQGGVLSRREENLIGISCHDESGGNIWKIIFDGQKTREMAMAPAWIIALMVSIYYKRPAER